jgi:hypothetical protein
VYERLAVDPSDVGLGAIITLTGYGCSGTGSLPINLFDTQTFNMGTAKIVNLPGQLVGAPNFIKVQGNASVCDGDSGSGSFVVEVVAGGMPSRKLVAINVRSSTQSSSILASMSTSAAILFVNEWAKAHNASICGMSAGLNKCHH